MCGRYALVAGTAALLEAFDVPTPSFESAPRFNVAPGQVAPVVAADRFGRRLGSMTWGLVPRWAKGPRPGKINARVETVGERASFREALERRRCLVPASGFFEWKREGGRKAPYWIRPARWDLISFAGIWERWSAPGADPKYTLLMFGCGEPMCRGVHCDPSRRTDQGRNHSRASCCRSFERGRFDAFRSIGW